jgi:hypothetical protein
MPDFTADRWRVQLVEHGAVTRESMFRSESGARAYYEALTVSGATKRLQLRRADERRFADLAVEVTP